MALSTVPTTDGQHECSIENGLPNLRTYQQYSRMIINRFRQQGDRPPTSAEEHHPAAAEAVPAGSGCSDGLRAENQALREEVRALKAAAARAAADEVARAALTAASEKAVKAPFLISVKDGGTGRGVPLVQLRTGNYINLWSDSAGNIAFDEPGLMGQPVFFSVLTDGYSFTGGQRAVPIKGDPAGTDPGIVLSTTSGGRATIYLNRTQHARRVYRLTGGGKYRDTLLVGAELPPTAKGHALLGNAGVLGQDSVQTAVYRGKVMWMFGDSVCARSARDDNCDSFGMFTVGY